MRVTSETRKLRAREKRANNRREDNNKNKKSGLVEFPTNIKELREIIIEQNKQIISLINNQDENIDNELAKAVA